MAGALDRILAEAGGTDLLDILAERLAPTDLQSLLLAVSARRAEKRAPADVLADYERSRFFGAAAFPRAEYAAFEAAADAVLAGDFEALTLSPMAPLATCSAVASVGQDWSIPTVRTGEVVSDPTNVLALEAALRRKRDAAGGAVHLATVQRVVRPQAFRKPGLLAHFALLALVSGGRDRGGYATEAEAIGRHLDAQLSLFRQLLVGMPLSVSYTIVTGSTDDARLNALRAAAALHDATVWEEADRPAVTGYYAGFCFHIWADRAAGRQQLADGGTVDWLAKLTANGRERCVISGCGVEGVLGLRAVSRD